MSKKTTKTVKAEKAPPVKKYELTEEHRAMLQPWAEKWIGNAMSTVPMSSDEKIACAEQVKKMYELHDMKSPKHIIFVPSPIAACIIGGFGAALADLGDKAQYTFQQMADIVLAANNSEPEPEKWFANTYNIEALNAKFGLGEKGKGAICAAHNMWNGGNQLSGWISYITFFRYVAKLDIDYTKWDVFEKLGEMSGPRIMHNDFCIISDRPKFISVNERKQPNNPNGAFCEWSDGCGLYCVNNVRVNNWIIRHPERITVAKINAEGNQEVRRVMVDKFGKDKYAAEAGKIIHQDDYGTLYKAELAGDEDVMMVKVVNSTAEPDGTYKDYWIRVDPKAYGGLKTAQAAVASTCRKDDGSLLFEDYRDFVFEMQT